ncbi:hypothetical protein [Rhizobium leguminosarum]|uniref:hypothetical protein n=1 Tax=Rhizobium leguminosarum TaxID=384 RepID=UPI0003621D08|nr:hypothetical protein [Rhizobium leguminosarum]MBY5772948.1 hypothetical protein [Rhizobium leguminosarum]MBY5823626.1 hypothetical protein [Rhizobium leguminosarum]
MVDRPARVVAKLYGQAGRSISRPVSANPKGRASFARTKAIGSDVPRGMPFANRLCPDENLLRQNASI